MSVTIKRPILSNSRSRVLLQSVIPMLYNALSFSFLSIHIAGLTGYLPIYKSVPMSQRALRLLSPITTLVQANDTTVVFSLQE